MKETSSSLSYFYAVIRVLTVFYLESPFLSELCKELSETWVPKSRTNKANHSWNKARALLG